MSPLDVRLRDDCASCQVASKEECHCCRFKTEYSRKIRDVDDYCNCCKGNLSLEFIILDNNLRQKQEKRVAQRKQV